MNAKQKIAILGGAGLAVYFLARKAGAALPSFLGGGQLSLPETSEIVRYTLATDNFPDVSPVMLGTVIEIESARIPTAIRAEPHINDFSVGMTQTLVRTANALVGLGFDNYPAPGQLNMAYGASDTRRVSESSAKILFDPRASIYFGAAALQDLYWYGSGSKSEEWIIRAYNGGPGWQTASDASKAMTATHWQRYQETEPRVRPYYTGNVSIF